jgi:hypothetical protein
LFSYHLEVPTMTTITLSPDEWASIALAQSDAGRTATKSGHHATARNCHRLAAILWRAASSEENARSSEERLILQPTQGG